jgi:hypothetical protein
MPNVEARPNRVGAYFNVMDHANEVVDAGVKYFWNESQQHTSVVEARSELAETVCRHAVQSKAVGPEMDLLPWSWSRIAQIDLVVFIQIAGK